MSNHYPITTSRHQGTNWITVVRDDLIPGGTKSRAIGTLLTDTADQVVYASPAYGYAQIALAHGARAAGKEAHIFVADRKRPHPRTEEAVQAGAILHELRPGYLSQITAAARIWATANDATLLPFGFDTPEFTADLADGIRAALAEGLTEAIPLYPKEVWVAAGSGTVSRALQEVWPDVPHHVVAVGREPEAGKATVHYAPEKFERDAIAPPPYPSTSNFDAKVWQYAAGRGPGTLIWNVAR